MSKLILSWGKCIWVVLILAGLVGIQNLVNASILESRKVGEFTFAAFDFKKDSQDRIFLKLQHEGKEYTIYNTDVTLSYVKNPRPLSCTLYAGGNATCQLEKEVEKK